MIFAPFPPPTIERCRRRLQGLYLQRRVSHVPVGFLLYLYVSHRSSLCLPLLKGSRNRATGYRYTSELDPSAWPVLEPSKFHMGQSENIYTSRGSPVTWQYAVNVCQQKKMKLYPTSLSWNLTSTLDLLRSTRLPSVWLDYSRNKDTEPIRGCSISADAGGSAGCAVVSLHHHSLSCITASCQDKHAFICDSATRCGILGNPDNGTRYISGDTVGSTATYRCHHGFTVSGGNATRVCQPTGNWSGNQPICGRVSCGDPGPVANATAHGSFLYGERFGYECVPGFELQQEGQPLSCGVHGQWLGKKPACFSEELDAGRWQDLSWLAGVVLGSVGLTVPIALAVAFYVYKHRQRENNRAPNQGHAEEEIPARMNKYMTMYVKGEDTAYVYMDIVPRPDREVRESTNPISVGEENSSHVCAQDESATLPHQYANAEQKTAAATIAEEEEQSGIAGQHMKENLHKYEDLQADPTHVYTKLNPTHRANTPAGDQNVEPSGKVDLYISMSSADGAMSQSTIHSAAQREGKEEKTACQYTHMSLEKEPYYSRIQGKATETHRTRKEMVAEEYEEVTRQDPQYKNAL